MDEFDPNQPFEIVSDPESEFDPNAPFEVVQESKPEFDPNAPFELAQESEGPREPREPRFLKPIPKQKPGTLSIDQGAADRINVRSGIPLDAGFTPEQLEERNKGGGWQSEIQEIESLDKNLAISAKAVDNVAEQLKALDAEQFVRDPAKYQEQREVLRKRLIGSFNRQAEQHQELNRRLKRMLPSDSQRESMVRRAKDWNAANPRDLKTPQDMAWDMPGLEGMLFDQGEDGFDEIRKDRDKVQELFEEYLEEARKNPEPTDIYAVKRLPVVGGVVSAMDSFGKRDSAKILEMSPRLGFHKKPWDDLEYLVAIRDMAGWVAAMEHEHGKTWFHFKGWEPFNKEGTKNPNALKGLGFLGTRTWDILTMAPGYAVEFALTGGAATGARKAVDKSFVATLRRQANHSMAKRLGPALGAAGKFSLNNTYRAGRFATAASAQTLMNPWLIARNLGHEVEGDINLSVDDSGHLNWKVEGMDMPVDLSRAYAYSVAEIGTERMGEVIARTKAWKQINNTLHNAKSRLPIESHARFDEISRRAGYNGPALEVMEERFNDISTYLYDLSNGREEFTKESLDRRIAKSYTDGQVIAEYVAFSLFGVGMNMGQTVINQKAIDAAHIMIREKMVGDGRWWDNQWTTDEAIERLQTSPELAELQGYTGQVVLTEDQATGKTSAVKVGEGAEALSSALVQAQVNNETSVIRGAFHLKAGVPSEVITAEWEQADGKKTHTFNSYEEALDHARALEAAGNSEAAMDLYYQATMQVQPPSEINQIDVLDPRNVNTVRMVKSRVKLSELERIFDKVWETEDSYEIEQFGQRLSVQFTEPEWSEGAVLKSLVGKGIVDPKVLESATPEERTAIAEPYRGRQAGVFIQKELNGQPIDNEWLIQLSLRADSATFRHETFHFFREVGVISEQEYQALVDDAVTRDEKAAEFKKKMDQALEEKNQKLADEYAEELEERIAYAVEFGAESRMDVESPIIYRARQLLSKLQRMAGYLNTRDLWRDIDTGKFKGRTPEPKPTGASGARLSVQGRDPILAAAAQEMRAGKLSGQQYRALVQEIDPILPRSMKPTKPSDRNLETYLGKKRAKLGLQERLESGEVYDFRIDIGTYNRSYDAVMRGELSEPVVAITAHREKNFSEGKSFKAGKALGYGGIAKIKGWATVKQDEDYAERIAAGEPKNTISAISGKYNPSQSIPRNIMAMEQVGYNPIRSSKYYDKNTGQAVVEMLDPIIIGTTVFAKKLKYDPNAPKYSIQKAPEGFRDMDHWVSTLKSLDTLGNQLTPGAKENLSVPDDPQGALQTLIDSTDVPEVKEAAKTLQKIFEGQPVEKRTKVQAVDKFESFVGAYYQTQDEVKLFYRGEKDLVLMHELVHAASSRVLDQYTSRLSRETGTNYIKRLKGLRDQIVSGVRVKTPPIPGQSKSSLKEKITPSDKDLLVARIIDAYIEAVDKMGPKELVSHELKSTPTISVIKRPDIDDHYRLVISNPGKPGAYDSIKDRHALFRKVLKGAGLGRGDYFADMGAFYLTENAVKHLQQKGEEGALKGFEKANHHTELFRFDHTERKRKKGLANTRKVVDEIGKRNYGFQNLSEFLSEAASNPAFMMQLAQIDLGEATEVKGWMTPGAKLRDRTAKSIRGLMASNFPIDLPPTPTGPGYANPLPPPSSSKPEHILKAERTLKKIEGRHTLLDEVAHIIADFHETKKPGDEYQKKDARYPMYSMQAPEDEFEFTQRLKQEITGGNPDPRMADALVWAKGKLEPDMRGEALAEIADMLNESEFVRDARFEVSDEAFGHASGRYVDWPGHPVDTRASHLDGGNDALGAVILYARVVHNPYVMSPSEIDNFAAEVLIHEASHALMYRAITNHVKFGSKGNSPEMTARIKNLESILEEARGFYNRETGKNVNFKMREGNYYPGGALYGLTNMHEFVAELTALDSDLVDLLSRMPAKSGEVSFLERAKQIVADLFKAVLKFVHKGKDSSMEGTAFNDAISDVLFISKEATKGKGAERAFGGDVGGGSDIRYSMQGGFKVQQLMLDDSGKPIWIDAPWQVDGMPHRFKTREEAQEEIDDLIRDTREEGMGDYSAEDYRVVEDGEWAGSYSIQGEQPVSNIPSQTQFGQMYSRVADAIEKMPMKKATFSTWMGRLKKLSRSVPKAYGMPKDYPAGERAFDQEELDQLEIGALFHPGAELTKEELLGAIKAMPVPEITFTPTADWAALGTKYEGMDTKELRAARDIQLSEGNGDEIKLIDSIISESIRGREYRDTNLPGAEYPSSGLGYGMITWQTKGTQYGQRHNLKEDTVAHTRFNFNDEQVDLIESQSDLHQLGAIKGYKDPTILDQWKNTKWIEEGERKGYGKKEAEEEFEQLRINYENPKNNFNATLDAYGGLRRWGYRVNQHNSEMATEDQGWASIDEVYVAEEFDSKDGEISFPFKMVKKYILYLPSEDGGSGGESAGRYDSLDEAINSWRRAWYSRHQKDQSHLPAKVTHSKNWNELNFRAVVQAAAMQGKKYVAFPSKWQQVAQIEGHSNYIDMSASEPPKAMKIMYDRMVFGTLAEAKRMAKRFGSKIVKREALGESERRLSSNEIISYFSGSNRRANELYHIIDANQEYFHDLAVALNQADPEDGAWRQVVDNQGDGDVAGAYDQVMRDNYADMDIDALTMIIESSDLLSLKHPDGGTVADFLTKKKQFRGKHGKPIMFNALEITPEMAGPIAKFSIQKAITPVMERIDPITKESIVDSPVPGKINENINKLDDLFKKFPNPLEDESTWRNFYAHVSGADWVVKPPYKAIDYASGRQDPADILGGMSKSQIENRLSGAKNGQLIKKAYESGKATPADTAMFFLWSILSRQKAVFPQETAFMQAVNEGAHKWIDKAAKGKFNKKELDKYLKWVQEALPEKTPGRAALDNLNSFGRNFLTIMGQKIKKDDPVTPEYAGKTRLAAWHDIMSNKKLTGRQKRRKMVAVAYGSGKGIGVGLKVISFTLLVTGNTDVFILDRVQVRHLWDAEARKDEFGGSSNVYTPAEYTGLAPMVDGLRGLAIYEALESGLEKSVKAAYEKLGRGKTFNMGGFHWDSWVASSLQEVDHGTVEYIIKKLTGTRQPMNYIGVREGRYNRWDRGIWYISAPGGTERMIQDSTGHWFLLPAEAYEGYINELKDGASKKTYEGKRVLPLGTKISTLKQSWTESEGYDQDAHDQVIATHGARLNSRQSDRLSSAFRSLRGQYSVQVSPEAQARINHINAAGAHLPPEPEVAPAYGSSYLADFQKRYLARASQKLIYFAGPKVGQEKTILQIEEAYSAAAVRKSQDELVRRLTDDAYESQAGIKLPKWMRVGKWASRLNEFLEKSVPLAAHLNATSRDAKGNFVFTDFEMRSGLMKEKDFNSGNHQVGDRIMVVNSLTGENDELVIGSFISTPDGRTGYQLQRVMTAERQEEIFNHFKEEFPDLIWAIEMYIDPALKGARQVVNGVEIPIFNRFSMEEMMGESDAGFKAVAGYTPDVVATKSLIGGILGLFNPGAGTRSPGRKYKTGKSRETGNVQDLFSGHSIRSFQMIQEKHRQRFRDAVLKHAARPLEEGEGPNNLPEGWVMLDAGMNDLIQRVKQYRQFFEDESVDGTEFYKKFLGKMYAERGRQLKIRREAVEVLMQQYVRIQFNNKLYNMGGWLIRNSKAMLLAHPGTMVVNAATNDLFTFEAAFQEFLKGISLLPVSPTEGKTSLRAAKELMVGNFLHRFPSLRRLAGLTSHYDEVVGEAIPEEVFASSVSLQDLDVKYEVSAGQYLREGELGAAALQLLQYGNIDVRAKQRMTYAFLKAHAVQQAKNQGLEGEAMRSFVDRYMKNPPRDILAKAVDAANLEYLNYADSPAWLQWFSATPYTALIMPFPRFGYHFLAKQITKAAAVKDVITKVPAEKRADAFGKLMAFSMFGLGGAGVVLDMLLRDDDDDEEARERIGTNYVKYQDPMTGDVRTKQLDREMITTARVNISWYAEKMGLGTESEEDFWMRVRNYPMVAMGGNAILAESDAREHGAWEGFKTYVRNTADLSKDFFSLGAGLKVPSKVWAEITSEPGSPKKVPAADPYATNVPLSFYLVEQSSSTFIPGTRQMNDLSVLINPERPKKTASKSLGYEPGAWEAVRANHLGAVLSRLAEREGLIRPMPRQGSVVTMSIHGNKGDSLERRLQRAEGLGKLGGPEANIFIDPQSYKPRLATIPESSIPNRTRRLELLRIMGLNLKPVQRGAYEQQIKPLPQLPSSGR